MIVEYSIDGYRFADSGVVVEKSAGLLDLPARKIPFTHSWNDVSGEDVSLAAVAIQKREITLDCWIKGTSSNDAISKINAFLARFDKDRFVQLSIKLSDVESKALTFLVYRSKEVKVNKSWRDGDNKWRFSISLIESVPRKHIYSFNSTAVIQLTAHQECFIGFHGTIVKVLPSLDGQTISGPSWNPNGARIVGIFCYDFDKILISSAGSGNLLWSL